MQKYKFFLLVLIALLPSVASAQDDNSFFSEAGEIKSNDYYNDLNYSLAFIDHRSDDVVWARIVYRMIDVRDMQNSPLYFPMRPSKDQKSLFKLMIDAVVEGIPVYRRNAREIRPDFTDMVLNSDLPFIFSYDEENDKYLILYDSITNSVSFENENYQVYIREQFRFLIQEVIYFDKHLSRFHSKIIAIAPVKIPRDVARVAQPLIDEEGENFVPVTTRNRQDSRAATDNKLKRDEANLLNILRESVVCWFLYSDLRPYLAKQMISQMANSAYRLSYDDFFTNKQYKDYLIGDNNMLNKLYSGKEKLEFAKLKQQIQQINDELIEIETSIWEY